MSWVLTGVSCQLSFFLHYAKGNHLECLDHCLFVSIMSWLLIRCVLTIVFLFPLFHGYLFHCQWSICIHYVMGTHSECLDNCPLVAIMSWILIGGVLTIVFSSPLCYGFSLGVS